MGIHALPQATVRTLGASQVLTDPAAVVKELLDNALDAHASSIAIDIHSNTLDTIQVRDNGHGIPPEDRALVARPHCTSKIRSGDDLKDIGGTSLGFRGEALASVAEMSGSLTISTRIEGEPVATSLKINSSGEVVGQERASTPVGTTIKITDFMKWHPVRKQIALKSTDKTLKKIKQLLQAYACARPQVRLSLRVLKAKNEKGNWMYAPKAGGNAEDAAFKVVGAACASQCIWSVIEEYGFGLQAFLPRIDADPTKISNIGAFISVDGRPLTASRGTAKQIVKHYKEAAKAATSNLDGCKDLFIYLEIQCPSGSYDANVEPAKDEVLFEDTDVVVAAAKKLFASVYPPKAAVDVHREMPALGTGSGKHRDDVVPGDRSNTVSPISPAMTLSDVVDVESNVDPNANAMQCTSANIALNTAPEITRPLFRSTMYGCDEEDIDLVDPQPMTRDPEADAEELRQARRDITVSNPWVLAKLHAVRRQQETEDDVADQVHSKFPRTDLHTNILPTPRASSPSLFPNNISDGPLLDEVFANDGRIVGRRKLPPPVPYVQATQTHGDETARQESFGSPARSLIYDYMPTANSDPAGTPLSAIPEAGTRSSPQKRSHQSRINNPFRPPQREHPEREKVWFDHLENIDKPRRAPARKHGNMGTNMAGLVAQDEPDDFVDDPRPLTPPRGNRDMRDFLRPVQRLPADDTIAALIERKSYPARQRAGSLNSLTSGGIVEDRESMNPSPGFMRDNILACGEGREEAPQASPERASKRRRTVDSDALCEISGNIPIVHDGGPDTIATINDPATPRPQMNGAGSKMSRRKSSRLPLERTPAGKATHDLTTTIRRTPAIITVLSTLPMGERSLLNWNEPSIDAYDVFSTLRDTISDEMTALADTLRELLINRVSDSEMVQDLRELVPAAFAAHEGGDHEVEF